MVRKMMLVALVVVSMPMLSGCALTRDADPFEQFLMGAGIGLLVAAVD